MKIFRISLFLCSMCLLSGQVSMASDRLPAVYSPLDWEMNVKKTKELFPNAEIQEHTETYGKTKLYLIYKITWKYFGDAYITIRHRKYKNIKLIQIATMESRHECIIGSGNSVPRDCRTRYGDVLLQVLQSLKENISREFGKPLGPRKPIDSSDRRETEYLWKRKGYTLYLTMSKGEQEDWDVSLTAMKDKK